MNKKSSIIEPMRWHKYQFTVVAEENEDLSDLWNKLIQGGLDARKRGNVLIVEAVAGTEEEAKKEIEVILNKQLAISGKLIKSGCEKPIYNDENFSITAVDPTLSLGKIFDKRVSSVQSWVSVHPHISYESPDLIPRTIKKKHSFLLEKFRNK